MKRKPYVTTGALFMGLIVLLGVMGVVSGLWSKNLVINGQVTTGDLNADWDCGYTNDDGATQVIPGGGGCVGVTEPAGDTGADPNTKEWPGFVDSAPFVRKDVGECTLTIGDQPNQTPTGFTYQVANVNIVNAYPSYECTITMFLSNTGSIPFNLLASQLTSEDLQFIEFDGCAFVEPVQVDPGNEEQLDCTVHVRQAAAQNVCTGTTGGTAFPVITERCEQPLTTTYSFGIEVCVAQWNEEATFGQCKESLQHEGPGPEEFGIAGVCSDGLDNDLDGLIDAADPGCLD